MKQIVTYLTFDGNCRQAMEFNKRCFGGELFVMPFSDAPGDHPKEAKDRLMHASLTTGAGTLMASDSMPGAPVKTGDNFQIMIQCDSPKETDRLFDALGQSGKVIMPLQTTFWAARFGMVTDQFGIGWMFNYEKSRV